MRVNKSGNYVTTLRVPGSGAPLEFEREPNGRLVRLAALNRTYIRAPNPYQTDYDDGFVITEHIELPGGFLRRVRADHNSWTEAYRWDSKGLLVEIDGTQIAYDSECRVIACRDASVRWDYCYSGPHLSVISTPRALRRIIRGADGRAVAYSENGRTIPISYDASGQRLPARRTPKSQHHDDLGRLWTITDPTGRVLTTYLWDGNHCLCAIAGEPDEPLAVVYSLDPSGTRVRVITRTGMRRIPRDAFGEALLDEPGVPGLFGGAIIDGLVHLPLRRLDPLTGSFDAPDPLDGSPNDPRRAFLRTGLLQIEQPPAGPYAVCRNNPVSLADPTGGASDLWWAIPSALTWSMQHTAGSLLGLWLGIDMSPLGFILDAIAKGNPFDLQLVGAHNFHMAALRTDGFLARTVNDPNAFTYQFYMAQQGPSFRQLDDTRVFLPDNDFTPSLYTSLLLFAPSGAAAFLTRGQRNTPHGTALTDWSRSGGTAQPAFIGSKIPIFPRGGIHFNTVQKDVKQQSGQVTELVPASVTLFGTLTTRSLLQGTATGLGLNVNDNVELTDSAGIIEITRILNVSDNGSATVLAIDTDAARLTTPPIALSGLNGPIGTENLTPVDARPELLDVSGSSNDYHPTQTVVRLSRAGAAVHFADITGLEAQLAIDSALPASLGNTLHVRSATATGNFNAKIGTTPTTFTVVTGTVPGVGTGVTVGPAATALPAIVQSVAGATVTIDRDISSLGAAGAKTNWRPLAPGAQIGTRSTAPETNPILTYTPDSVGTAPSSGFVWVDGAGTAVQRVASRAYDAVIMSQPRSDADPSPYSVDRFTKRLPPSASGFITVASQSLAMNMAPPANVLAYQVIQLSTPTIAAGTAITANATVTVGTATATFNVNPASPVSLLSMQAGNVVVVTPAAGPPIPATVLALRLTVTLDRDLPISASALQCAWVKPDALVYNGVRRGDRTVRVRPFIGAGAAPVDLPRFVPNELISIAFNSVTLGGAKTFLARVDAATGSTIPYSNDQQPLPADAVNITVTRLIANDPKTGSARSGIAGTQVAPNQIEFRVWQVSDLANNTLLAIIDGTSVFAASVTSATQPLNVDLAMGTVTGPVALAQLPTISGTGVSASFTSTGALLNFNDAPLGAAIGTGLVIAVPFIAGAATVSGDFHNGSVRVPKDHENDGLEHDRRSAVVDHELTHTLQSLRYGPILLSYLPIGLFEFLTDLTDMDGPLLPNFGDGNLTQGVLSGTNLQPNAITQVAQNGRLATITIGKPSDAPLTDSARRILAGKQIQDGAVKIRQFLGQSTWNNVFRITSNITEWLTIGGLLNLITIGGWGGLASLIIHIVHWIKMARHSTVSATLADDHKTLTLSSSLDGLSASSSVSVKSGDDTLIRSLASLDGTTAVLQLEVPFTGTVEVGVYALGTALFGAVRSYYPATLSDTNKPTSIKIASIGGDTLRLEVHDRVQVRSPCGATYETQVLAVEGDTMTVEDPVHLQANQPNEFLVARMGHEDPAHWTNEWLLDKLNIGFMKYVNDPIGQFGYAYQFKNHGLRITESVIRNLLGTHGWLLGVGYFWFDNASQRLSANPTGYRSNMEQEASHNSGDTYSPIGTLHGNPIVVGDVGRYWLTVNGGSRYGSGTTPNDLILFGLQDAPGVHYQQAGTLTGGAANFAVPNDFYLLSKTGAFNGIDPRGFVPVSSSLERTVGVQVAFSLPGACSVGPAVTTGVTATDISNATDAQTRGVWDTTIKFTPAIADVAVTIATVSVAENTAASLIPFQRAAVSVTPNGNRVYRATPAEPGFVVDVDGNDLVVKAASGTDDVEISRFHHFNSATNSFDSGIAPIHLPSDLDIAVRRIQVQVVTTISFRPTLDQNAAPSASALPGDSLFLLVPAQIAPVQFGTSITGTPSTITPQITPSASVPAEVQAFIRDGAALSVVFPADQPPEQNATVTITISVGPDAASAVALTATLPLNAHFTLDVVGGGAFQVAKGASIVLQSSDATNLASDTSIAGVTVTPNNAQVTVAIDAAFGVSSVVVLVHDTANARRMARRTLTIT
jgi:hypothetical protein